MAKAEYWQRGEALDYTNSGASKIDANTIIKINGIIGVAGGDIEAGATGSVHVVGVWEFPKATGVTLAMGNMVYWDDTNGNVTTTAAGNIPMGYAVAAAASADIKALISIGSVEGESPVATTVAAVSAADGVAAAGAAPTKAEYDAVVTLANANKAAINAVIAALKAAGLMANG